VRSAEIRTECHAGYRGDETPRHFELEGRTIEITEVLAQWTEPNPRLFRMRGDDGLIYVLRLDERGHCWNVPEITR
jgi:hypothetical protein